MPDESPADQPTQAIPITPPHTYPAPVYNSPEYATPASYSSGYSSFGSASARPGVLITVAIVSILIGLLSVLVSGFTSIIWRQMAIASMPPRAIAPPPLPAAAFQPYSGSVIPPGGFSAPLRVKIISALQKKTELSVEQSQMLNTILAEDGADILPNRSADDLHPQEELHSQHPLETVHFKTPQGTLTMNPGMCSYSTPDDVGSINVTGNVVHRYNAKDSVFLESWNSASMESALNQIRTAVPGVTNMQLGFVLNELQDPANRTSTGMLPAKVPLTGSPGAGNILNVTIDRDHYQVLPDGRGIKIDDDHPGLDPSTGWPLAPTKAACKSPIPGDPHLMRLTYQYNMASVALAIYLIAGAIVTLIRPWLWAWMHLSFATLKLIGIVTETCLSIAFFASASTGGQTSSNGATTWMLVTGILQAIYPIALILLYLLNPRLRRMPRG